MLGVFGCPVSVSDADTCSTAARGGAAVSYAAPVMHNLPRLHDPAPPVNTARNVSRVILSSEGYFLRSLAAEYFLQVITSGCAGYC